MDFRQSDPEVGTEDGAGDKEGMWRVPSFLYVLPVDENTVFVEVSPALERVDPGLKPTTPDFQTFDCASTLSFLHPWFRTLPVHVHYHS